MMYEGDEIMAVCRGRNQEDSRSALLLITPNAMLQNLKIMYENVARGEKSPADSIQAMYDSMKAISGE